MKDPNHELESAKFFIKYQSSIGINLHLQALERIVDKYNDGSISAEAADKQIRAVHDIRAKFDDIKSSSYVNVSIEHLEMLYLEY